MLFDIHTQAWK